MLSSQPGVLTSQRLANPCGHPALALKAYPLVSILNVALFWMVLRFLVPTTYCYPDLS